MKSFQFAIISYGRRESPNKKITCFSVVVAEEFCCVGVLSLRLLDKLSASWKKNDRTMAG
jgi:hypothetical protein